MENGYHVAHRQERAFAGDVCDRPMSQGEWRNAYSASYPSASYEKGSTHCVAWTMQKSVPSEASLETTTREVHTHRDTACAYPTPVSSALTRDTVTRRSHAQATIMLRGEFCSLFGNGNTK